MRPGRALVLAATSIAPALYAQKAPLAGYDAYVTKAMQDWKVPGLSIAVVKNDSIVYARGFGVRRVGAEGAVDAQTLFGMMSTTKASGGSASMAGSAVANPA